MDAHREGSGSAPVAGAEAIGRPLLGLRLPVLLQAPDRPPQTAEIPADGASPARFTLRVIAGAKRFTLPAAALLVISMLGEALVPVIVGGAVGSALVGGDFAELLRWLLLLGANFLVFTLCFRFGSRLGLYGMQRVQHRLRTAVTERLLLGERIAGGPSDGAAVSIATNDVARVAAAMQIGVYPIGELAALLFCAIWLFVLSPWLGIAVLVGATILLVLLFSGTGPLQRRALAQQSLEADAVGQAADLLTGYRTIKGLRAEAEASRRFRVASRAALAGTLRTEVSHGWYLGTTEGLTGVFTAGLTVLAGVLALSGQIGVGGLISAVGVLQFMVGPLTGMPAQTGAIWATALASAERVLTVLQRDSPATADATPAADATSVASATPVSNATPVSEETAPDRSAVPRLEFELHGAGSPLRIESGELIGLRCEPQDAERLARLLAAVPGGEATGTVSLNGCARAGFSVENWRSLVLVSPHRPELFDGTLAWNLEVPGGDPALVPAALAAAGCEDIVRVLPQGVETPIGEGGTRLSGGQRQRIALARAYVANPPILVLHEPTTSVDSATEQLIGKRIAGIRLGRTTILITTSPNLLAACDRVVELGTHPEKRDTE